LRQVGVPCGSLWGYAIHDVPLRDPGMTPVACSLQKQAGD
jgi:hypothetical protein